MSCVLLYKYLINVFMLFPNRTLLTNFTISASYTTADKKHAMAMQFKGIVSRDFEGLQMILMKRSWVPDVPLVVCYFLNFRFHISSKFRAG